MHAIRYTIRLAALALLALALVPAAGGAGGKERTATVRNQAQFEAAIARLRATGGTIELLPGRYPRRLLVARRFGGRLRIAGRAGAVVQRLVLYRTARVTVGPLKLRPLTADARIRVLHSRGIVLRHVDVSALGKGFSAGVEIPNSHWVAIRQSTFTRCGDRSPNWVNCLNVRNGSDHVSIVRSWFHDCRGCDFVHGRVRTGFTVRKTRFERALPCRLKELNMRLVRRYLGELAAQRCMHQDLVELFAGDRLVFEHNRFGVYSRGGAQLYLTGRSRGDLIADNLFVAKDRRAPRAQPRVGILVGGGGGGPLPERVRIVRNRIYSGARRPDGYAGSIMISRGYGWRVKPAARPLVAHNVLGLLETPARLCHGARMVANRILHGHGCEAGR